MKRFFAVAIAALALSGSAGADVFKVVPSVMPSAPAALGAFLVTVWAIYGCTADPFYGIATLARGVTVRTPP